MTYTAVNPHACCNRPRPEDAHASRHRTPTHHPTSPTGTDCVERLMAGRQQTAPPQQRRSKDVTAHPHQPGAHPDPPHPDRAHSRRHHPAKAKVKFPLRNRIFFMHVHAWPMRAKKEGADVGAPLETIFSKRSCYSSKQP
jgi:hypothetical protein